ncbi:hypothetical protein ACFPK9_15880 [Rubritalea spongiae]|uniref:Uncharacterized protein n=1 Tax=Rubritalea spongiae TaxID=430797 RepID=A0ABW5DYC4_9BACT
MHSVFQAVYEILKSLSDLTGFSYNEINIIAYYIIAPLVYISLIDKILGKHILKIIFLVLVGTSLVFIPDFRVFSDWLFDRSVDFLLWFEVIGWNYTVSSVFICVLFPGILLIALMYYAFPSFRHFLSKDLTKSQNSH